MNDVLRLGIMRLFQAALVLWPIILGFYIVMLGDVPFGSVHFYLQVAPPLTIGLLAVLGAVSINQKNRRFLLPSHYAAVFALLIVVATISPILSMPEPIVHIILFYIKFFLLLLGVITALWISMTDEREWAMFVVALASSIVLFVAVIFPMLPEYFAETEYNWGNGIVPFYNIRRFTHLVIIAIAAATGLAVWAASEANAKSLRKLRLPIFLFLVFGWSLIFWAGSRAPLLAFFAVSLFFLTLASPALRAAYLWFWLAPSVIGALISTQIAGLGWPNSIFRRVQQGVEAESVNQLSSGRLEVWRIAYENFLESPIFGHGHNTYTSLGGGVETPHNFILEMLHDFGLVGGLPLLIMVFVGSFSLSLKVWVMPS